MINRLPPLQRARTNLDWSNEDGRIHRADGVRSGRLHKPVPDYRPYTATGDFNSDGVEDFAVVLIDRSKQEKNFALIVFNGAFKSEHQSPAFFQSSMDLKYYGLVYGPPRSKPYRLLLSQFESDSGVLLVPRGHGYRWAH